MGTNGSKSKGSPETLEEEKILAAFMDWTRSLGNNDHCWGRCGCPHRCQFWCNRTADGHRGQPAVVCGFAGVASLGAGALMSWSTALEETTSMAAHMKEKMEALADGCGKSIGALNQLDRVLIRDNTQGKAVCSNVDMTDEQLVHVFSQQGHYDELKAMEVNLKEVLLKARALSDQTALNYAELIRRK